jgi:hypothetical protein
MQSKKKKSMGRKSEKGNKEGGKRTNSWRVHQPVKAAIFSNAAHLHHLIEIRIPSLCKIS